MAAKIAVASKGALLPNAPAFQVRDFAGRQNGEQV